MAGIFFIYANKYLYLWNFQITEAELQRQSL